MNKDQFIYWLKGFVDAAQVSPTQIQWGIIKEKLDEIKDCPDYSSPIGEGGWGTPNTTPNTYRGYTPPFPTWQEPHYTKYPSDINKVTCNDTTFIGGISGSASANGAVTIKDGFIQRSDVTVASPPYTLTIAGDKDVVYTLGETGTSKDCILNELRKDDSKDS